MLRRIAFLGPVPQNNSVGVILAEVTDERSHPRDAEIRAAQMRISPQLPRHTLPHISGHSPHSRLHPKKDPLLRTGLSHWLPG